MIPEDALSVWTTLGKHSLFFSSVKTDTMQEALSVYTNYPLLCDLNDAQEEIVRPDGLCVLCPSLHYRQKTSNECLPKFIHTGNASSSVKTAIISDEVLETPA